MADSNVGSDEAEHCSHVRCDHSAALGDSANVALSAFDFEFNGDLLLAGVGGHYCFACLAALLGGKLLCEGGYARLYRLDGKRLTDNSGGAYENIVSVDIKRFCGELAHLFGDLNAVFVAGVGVAGVNDNRLRAAVLEVLFCNVDRSALHLVGGVESRSLAALSAEYHSEVALGGVAGLYSCDNAGGGEALGSADAAVYEFVTFKFNHFMYLTADRWSRQCPS